MIQSLISAARKFYDSLLQINEKLSLLSSAIQQQTAAIDKANDATEKHYDTPPMVRTELHIPEADKEEQKRGRIEKKWIGRVQTVLEGLTLAAIVYYACVAQHQWKEMQRAAKAAEGANTIARDALVRSNRPWVGVSEPVQIQGKLILSPKLVVNSYVTMKNYGQSPAFHVLIDVSPVSDYSKLKSPVLATYDYNVGNRLLRVGV